MTLVLVLLIVVVMVNTDLFKEAPFTFSQVVSALLSALLVGTVSHGNLVVISLISMQILISVTRPRHHNL